MTSIVDVGGGVRLAYDEAGTGDPAIVLVHGMACTRSHLRPQFDHLSRRHRVVSLDLRGHGESDKPAGIYDTETFVADLLAVFGALDLDRPVLVGHSLGGSISLALAASHPESLRALVLLDSGIRRPATKSAELAPFYARLGGPDHADRVRDFVLDRLCDPRDDPAVAAQIAATMGATPAHVFLSMAEGVLAFDSSAAGPACTVPSMLIQSEQPFTDPEVLARLGSNWTLGRVEGAGHFIQLLAPDRVNSMLERFLLQLPTSERAPSPDGREMP